MGECCIEFIHLISSEANEICEKGSKKTINGEHVQLALKALGFDDYVSAVYESQQEFQKNVKETQRKSFKLEDSGLTHEELLLQQELLFAKARERLQGESTPMASAFPEMNE